MNFKNKSFMTKKKAFTLIELLIVIAIIGILFIVLVSKVDFATDKAKTTGVQTDFRSFQMAFDTVAREHAGFSELVDDNYDKLEVAINKNLDVKLHIDIDDTTGGITMVNGAQDPWKTPYHGTYIAGDDGKDRGAVVMYSNGANLTFGSEATIADGIVTIVSTNDDGKDDYAIVSCYSLKNNYGEVTNTTVGFSNNQVTDDNVSNPTPPIQDEVLMIQGANLVYTGSEEMKFVSNAVFSDLEMITINDVKLDESNYSKSEGSTIIILNPSYMSTLENGKYTIGIVSSTGTASCTFTVDVQITELQGGLYQTGAIDKYLSGDINGAKAMIIKTWSDLSNDGIISLDGTCNSEYDWDTDTLSNGLLEGDLVVPSSVETFKINTYSHHKEITGIYISNGVSTISGYVEYMFLKNFYIPRDIEVQDLCFAFSVIRKINTGWTKDEFIEKYYLTKVEDHWSFEYVDSTYMYYSGYIGINNTGKYGANVEDPEVNWETYNYWEGIPVYCQDGGYLELKPDWT